MERMSNVYIYIREIRDKWKERVDREREHAREKREREKGRTIESTHTTERRER